MSLLARLSVAHRGLVALIAVVVTGLGVFTVPSLKQQLLPSLEFPAAFVVASYPGAAPELVEGQVVRPIEDAVRGVAGLSKVTSTASEGNATIGLEFEFGTDLDDAVNQVRTSLRRADRQLPDGVEPEVFAGGTDDLPVVVLAAAGGGPGEALAEDTGDALAEDTGDAPAEAAAEDPAVAAERRFAEQLDRAVVPRLREIDGVRQVAVTGVREQLVVITPDRAKLAAAGLRIGVIGSELQANGIALAAGGLTVDGRSYTVQAGQPITSLEQLGDLPMRATAGTPPIRLRDIATVTRELAPPTAITRTNGAPSLGIRVTATEDGNAVEISHAVHERLAELTAALGGGAELTVVFDQAPFVERSIDSLTTEGLLGLLMAVLVILIFLLSVRSTLVIAVSIPLSVVVALIALWVGDHSLNLLTLGGLTVAIGRVVDDSIVVLENIKRHLGYGEDKQRAVLHGVREVAGAVTASTLTTVAVFAPVGFVGGFVGQLFAPFAVTVTVALLASLLVSLTVVPVLAYRFLPPAAVAAGDGEAEAAVRRAAEAWELRSPLQRGYLPVIQFATRRRLATVMVGVVVLLGTLGLGRLLETNFIDRSGQNVLTINQQLPAGTSLAATDQAAGQVERVLAGAEQVSSYQVTVGRGLLFGLGGGGGGGGGANSAQFRVAVDADADTGQVVDDLRDRFAALSGAGEITVVAGASGGYSADRLQVTVRAGDPDALALAAGQVRGAMAGTPQVTDVTSGLAERAPRVEVIVNRVAAKQRGLSESGVSQFVSQALSGSPLGQVTLDGQRQGVMLRLGSAPDSLDALRTLSVPTVAGPVPLQTVAEVNEVTSPVRLTRIDGVPSVTVTGTATGDDIGATTEQLRQRLAALDLPGDSAYTLGGVSADQAEAFDDLGLALLAAVAIVFIIMAATFRSLVQPLILLVSVPFAATGAVVALLVTGTPLGVPALIGVLMLVGIVVTNAIVLLDLINQYRAQGMGVHEAVAEGARRRLRPILMTAVATIVALLPMAFGLTGEGGFISRPLAVVVIGGLLSSTLLTLVLVPTLYTLVEDAAGWLRERGIGGRDRSPGTRSGGGFPAGGDVGGAAAGARGAAGGAGSVAAGGARAGARAGSDGAVLASPGPVDAVGSAEPARATRVLREKTDQFEVLRLPRMPSTQRHSDE